MHFFPFISGILLCCCTVVSAQLSESWWDALTTTPSPSDDLYDYYDNNYDDVGPSDVCCECVPFYLCGENNTIIEDGTDTIAPRFGGSTDVELCPDPTHLCCRLPTASPTCDINKNRNTPHPDTPCHCANWDFCLEEFRVSDGSPSKTTVDGITLPGYAKCKHSLEVCCEVKAPETPLPVSPTLPPARGCVCVNPGLCGEDGIIITDGSGGLNLRNTLHSSEGTCTSPQICCREPVEEVPATVTLKPTVPTPVIPKIHDQRCNGIRNRDGVSVRITGFEQGESQVGEFPWVGMILRTYFVAGTAMNAFIGGAILIHPRVLLTAAHKVASEDVPNLSVRLGEWDIETDYEPGEHQVRLVESVIVHPRFNSRNLHHDVALIILTEPIVLHSHIRSICLADSLDQVDTTACVINGWGKDSFDKGNFQTVMKSVTLPLVPNRRCQAQLRRTRLGRWFKLHQSFLCAGGELGKDACTSDGGGPLACPLKGSSTGEYMLVGITAWGVGCGEDGVPGVYASVLADKRWISVQMEDRFPGHTSVKRQAEELVVETYDAGSLTVQDGGTATNGDCDPSTGICSRSPPPNVTTTEANFNPFRRPRSERRNSKKRKNKNRDKRRRRRNQNRRREEEEQENRDSRRRQGV